MTLHILPGGQTVRLVSRDLMRRPTPVEGLLSAPTPDLSKLPKPPASFDWSKGGTLSFPPLGNDRYGDCYYAAVLHQTQAWTGNAGVEASFDPNATIKRYLSLSPWDQGLSDAVIMKEWRSGILGPNGPHRIIDEFSIDPSDLAAVKLALWAFGGLTYTAALADVWLDGARPGVLWDVATPNPNKGHAMYVSGVNADGTLNVQTWGFSPPVRLTYRGLLNSDPALIAAVSVEMFDPKTGLSPAGLTWEQTGEITVALGGQPFPPSPFPPAPTPVPVPPAPNPVPVPVPPTPVPVPPAGLTLDQVIAAMRKGIDAGRPYSPFNAVANIEHHAEMAVRAAWPKPKPALAPAPIDSLDV